MTGDDEKTRRLAGRLLEEAVQREQAAHRLEAGDDADAVRAEVRRMGRAQGISIRTSTLDDVLVVVRSDAAIWQDTTAVMRIKLTPWE